MRGCFANSTIIITTTEKDNTMNTTINITGMTCGHCVSSVTEELTEIDGVENVEVNLNKGGASSTVITSSRELSSDEINDAVTEAGYQVVTENA